MKFRKKTNNARITAAAALQNTGRKLAGDKGEKAARRVSDAVLGGHLEQCGNSGCQCNSNRY